MVTLTGKGCQGWEAQCHTVFDPLPHSCLQQELSWLSIEMVSPRGPPVRAAGFQTPLPNAISFLPLVDTAFSALLAGAQGQSQSQAQPPEIDPVPGTQASLDRMDGASKWTKEGKLPLRTEQVTRECQVGTNMVQDVPRTADERWLGQSRQEDPGKAFGSRMSGQEAKVLVTRSQTHPEVSR